MPKIICCPLPPDESDSEFIKFKEIYYLFKKEIEPIPENEFADLGKIFIRDKYVFLVNNIDLLEEINNKKPIIFIDESIASNKNINIYGGTIFSEQSLLICLGRYLTNIANLKALYKQIWTKSNALSRLHYRELAHFHAKNKTGFRDLSYENLNMLIYASISQLQLHSPLCFACLNDINEMTRTMEKIMPYMKKNNPDIPSNYNISHFPIMVAAAQVGILLKELLTSNNSIKIVPDNNSTLITVGKKRSQATRHFAECLISSFNNMLIESKIWSCQLEIDANSKHSSKFPHDFTFEAVTTNGYSARKLIYCFGLQITDIYLNIWRKNYFDKLKPFGVEVRPPEIIHMDWLPKLMPEYFESLPNP